MNSLQDVRAIYAKHFSLHGDGQPIDFCIKHGLNAWFPQIDLLLLVGDYPAQSDAERIRKLWNSWLPVLLLPEDRPTERVEELRVEELLDEIARDTNLLLPFLLYMHEVICHRFPFVFFAAGTHYASLNSMAISPFRQILRAWRGEIVLKESQWQLAWQWASLLEAITSTFIESARYVLEGFALFEEVRCLAAIYTQLGAKNPRDKALDDVLTKIWAAKKRKEPDVHFYERALETTLQISHKFGAWWGPAVAVAYAFSPNAETDRDTFKPYRRYLKVASLERPGSSHFDPVDPSSIEATLRKQLKWAGWRSARMLACDCVAETNPRIISQKLPSEAFFVRPEEGIEASDLWPEVVLFLDKDPRRTPLFYGPLGKRSASYLAYLFWSILRENIAAFSKTNKHISVVCPFKTLFGSCQRCAQISNGSFPSMVRQLSETWGMQICDYK